MRRSLRFRIFLSIFIVISVIYIGATSSILFNVQKIFIKNYTSETQKNIISSSEYFNSIFNGDVEVLRTIKNVVEALHEENEYDELIVNQRIIINNIIEQTPNLLSIAINWEINAIDSTYKKTHGRYRYLYHWKDGKIVEKIDTLDIDAEQIGGLYYLFKISKKEDVTDIYFDSYTGRKEDEELMSSIGIPIVVNDNFIGLAVCDIALERFNTIIKDIKVYQNSQTFLVSQNGKIIANSTNKHINQPLSSILKDDVAKYNLLFKIEEDQSFSYIQKDDKGNKNLVVIEPFYFGNINRVWGVGVIVPFDVIQQDANRLFRISVLFAVIGLILMVVTILIIVNTITKPINEAADSLERLSEMDINQNLKLKTQNTDEIAKISNSINKLVDSLTKMKDFTLEISKGNLNSKLELTGEDDVLGVALQEMQRNLKIAKIEEDKRDVEEQMQKWSIAGESEISSILRQYAQDIDQLSYEIVSYLVKYTQASQGALFIVNDEEEEIQLLAAYAYNRRKYLRKKIPFGIGLVGRSVQEGETIYISDIPSGYTSIASGLGEEEPRTLLIIPFKFNEVIYAVIELSSFKDFKPNVRKFIERIGISVASTVANVQITNRTNILVADLQAKSSSSAIQI